MSLYHIPRRARRQQFLPRALASENPMAERMRRRVQADRFLEIGRRIGQGTGDGRRRRIGGRKLVGGGFGKKDFVLSV